MSEEQMTQKNAALVVSDEALEKRKYPILLVHGVGMRDDTWPVRYWGEVPSFLESLGWRVFLSHQDAMGGVDKNAEQLKRRIDEILVELDVPRVHIIAHSKGGLDTRSVLRDPAYCERVCSFITLSTPHAGSPYMERILSKVPKWALSGGCFLVDVFYRLRGDKNPHAKQVCYDLLPDRWSRIREDITSENEMRSHPIYIASFTGKINAKGKNRKHGLFRKPIEKLEGEHDGLVSVQSASWGEYQGLLYNDGPEGFSHVTPIGRHGMGFPMKLKRSEVVEWESGSWESNEEIEAVSDLYRWISNRLCEVEASA